MPSNTENITIRGKPACIANHVAGLTIVDIADPAKAAVVEPPKPPPPPAPRPGEVTAAAPPAAPGPGRRLDWASNDSETSWTAQG
jgi:hypothetical protein